MKLNDIKNLNEHWIDEKEFQRFIDAKINVVGRIASDAEILRTKINYTMSRCSHGNWDNKAWDLNEDNTITYNKPLRLSGIDHYQLPDYIRFREIRGAFTLYDSLINSWVGMPRKVIGDISIERCGFTSLVGFPQEIEDANEVVIEQCPLVGDLTGLPVMFDGDLTIKKCGISSLNGGPAQVDGNLSVIYTKLKNLEGIPHTLGNTACFNHNPHLTTFEGISRLKRMTADGKFAASDGVHNLKECGLHLLLVEGLKFVYLYDSNLEEIINRHLAGGAEAIFDCQENLIKAGYEEFAKL